MRKRKGVTLIELLLALALVGGVIAISFNFLNFGTVVQSKSSSEVSMQSSMRLMSEHINKTIRFATKAHTIPQSSFQYSEDGVRDPETSYIGVTKDGHVVIDEPGENPDSPRKVQYIAKNDGDTEYEIEFYPAVDSNGKIIDKLLGYKVTGIKNGKKVNEIKSEVEVLNALNIEHLGTSSDPAVALGYTMIKPGTQSWEKVTPDGYVTLVLDLSGSMDWDMDGKDNTTNEKRIDILKEKALGMVDRLASLDFDIYVSLVPFGTDANSPENFKNINTTEGKQFINNKIQSFSANRGGTNTGDGMRRAYYQLQDATKNLDKTKISQHMMILVDGGTNQESYRRNSYWYETGPLLMADGNSTSVRYPSVSHREIVGTRRVCNWFRCWYEDVYENVYRDDYVNAIGDLIKANTYEDEEGEFVQAINTFVIGFSNREIDFSSLENIGIAVNGKKFEIESEMKPYILAKNADDLDFAFEQFENEIVNNLWLITRPKLKPTD